MELFKAHRQWASRPDDERFASLTAMYNATKAYAQQAREKTVEWDVLRVEAVKSDVQLVGKAGVPARLTHWAFGQLCSRVGAPPSYLRELPATLASQNLNYGLANKVEEGAAHDAQLLFHYDSLVSQTGNDGSLLLRAVTSDLYHRIWNFEVIERLLELEKRFGWEPARPDINVIEGRDWPSLYASDHDMFAFLRNRQAVIREPGNPDGLQRGVIVENSEVGDSALNVMRFLYRAMCGNHIIWGAQKVVSIQIRHVGERASEKWGRYAAEIRRYAEESASEEEQRIVAARKFSLGKTKEEVLDTLFSNRKLGMSRKLLTAGYDAVVPEQDGDPNTVWGMVQGLTRHSQTIPYADQRTQVDRQAGKLLELVF